MERDKMLSNLRNKNRNDSALYLVCEIDSQAKYKMKLNRNQLKFLHTAIPDFLWVYEELEITNPEDQKDNELYFIENEFLGSKLVYLNSKTNRLLKKLDFKTQKYDCIEEIDFYDWILINKEEIEICLDREDYKDPDYTQIFEKMYFN
jgi:hypothetical protein